MRTIKVRSHHSVKHYGCSCEQACNVSAILSSLFQTDTYNAIANCFLVSALCIELLIVIAGSEAWTLLIRWGRVVQKLELESMMPEALTNDKELTSLEAENG